MLLDGHLHIWKGEKSAAAFLERTRGAGVDGAVVFSLPPACFPVVADGRPNADRLSDLLEFCSIDEKVFPFFFLDPMEPDALDQVDEAARQGVAGFKIICKNFSPGDERAMRVFKRIAHQGKPILFHSGILWDGAPSSQFNRPAMFEHLFEIDGLRFLLAHVSWPWFDECIAVYGKFLNAYVGRPDLSVEMFIDVSPGTPPIYRREVLTKLFTIGYDVANNVVFGTDSNVNDYNVDWLNEWLARDNAIYDEIGLDEQTRRNIYGENLLRFLGKSEKKVEHEAQKVAGYGG